MEMEERDLVTFLDENDNEVVMELIDRFFYEGTEYVVLIDYTEEENDEPTEAIFMAVNPLNDEEEEFLPIDEKLAQKLIELYDSDAFMGDFEDEDEE